MAKSENPDVAVLQDWRERVDETLERIEKKIDDLDGKFAAKWVQWIVGGMVGAVLFAFLGVVLSYFIPTIRPLTPAQSSTTTATGTTTTTTPTPPSASANSSATATPANPTATDGQSSGGGITIPLPKKL